MKASRLSHVLDTLLTQPWAVFIWGAPGIGKSSLVRQVAERHQLPIIDIRASLLDPTDLRGIPMLENHRAVWCPPSFLPTRDMVPGILFLDEINAAPPLVQAALYQLILDRRIGEYELPKGWHIIAAGNRREDQAVTFKLSSALANRFIHLNMEIDHDDWHDWAVKQGIIPEITAFLQYRPQLLTAKADGQQAFATPRTWEMASDVIKQFGAIVDARDVLPGIIGPSAAVEFMTFAKKSVMRQEIDALIADPTNAPLPDQLDRLWVLVNFLTAQCTKDEVLDACVAVLPRLPTEFAMVLIRDLIKKKPVVVKHPTVIDFIKTHKIVLF